MKKVLIVLLSFVMCLCISACGSKDDSGDASSGE